MSCPERQPIACMLGPADYEARLAWIADLARDALWGHQRHDLDLELVYAADAAQRVREMVEKERECCAFLVFDLDEQLGEIRLTIRAPESAREIADRLFGPFLPSVELGASCGCC